MNQPRCTASAKHGGSCRAFALPGRETCRVHAPEYAAAVQADRVRGGQMAGRLRAIEGKRKRLDSPRALVKFLSDVAVNTLSGSIDPSVSRAVVYAVATLRQTMESADLEQRLARLEQQLAQQGTKRWA